MKKKFLTATLVLLSISILPAQELRVTTLSLKECVGQAVEKNINVVKAKIDKEKSGYKVTETRSNLLPQVNVGGSFQDNLQLPTTILPGDLIGQPGTTLAVQMGVQYNTSAAITVNQLLYNQTAMTSLKLSKKADNLNQLGVEKASESLTQEVAKLYFLAQTTAEQKKLIEENISRTKRMTDITKVLLDNGMGKKVDYDRINVTLQNLYTQLSNTEALHEQQLNMIKYTLEIPIQENIILTDTADMPLLQSPPTVTSDFSRHIDIQMLESQKEIALLNEKIIKDGYLPTLSFTGQYAYSGMRNDFKDYFNSSPANTWYGSSYVGINLSIPIFDGLQKSSKSRQAKLEYYKTQLTLDNTKEKFNADYKNALNNYTNNKSNVSRQGDNIELAKKVYMETALKYREGLATMSDLLQDEMGLNNAQASYLNALFNFKEAELKIMSLTGEIRNLMKN